MGISGVSKEVIGENTSLIQKMVEHATKIADAVCPEPAGQETERESIREVLRCAVESLEKQLAVYAVPFQKKVLQVVMENFPAKEAQYEQEVRRQEADDNLLDATSEWPVEEVEALVAALRSQKNE